MKTRSRSESASPREVIRIRARKAEDLTGVCFRQLRNNSNEMVFAPAVPQLPTLTLQLNLDPLDPPKISLDNVELRLNMEQVDGLFKEQNSPERQRNSSLKGTPAVPRRGLLSRSEVSPSPEPQAWSSAVGHASTGKSGRVIERLQGEIDRLHREKQLLKVRFEESEKTNETLQTRNQYLQDRNSNYEQSHEANLRQLARKERQVEDFRDELKREKQKTAIALQTAQAATQSEEEWRDQASQAKSIAAQKESEYEAMVSCRKLDHDRHQGGLDRMKENFEALLRDRQEDLDRCRKLEIIAEQQKQTINQLEELTKRLNANFRAYRMEIDKAIADLREHANTNESAIVAKLDEMTEVTGQMRWVMNLDKEGPKDKELQKGKDMQKGSPRKDAR